MNSQTNPTAEPILTTVTRYIWMLAVAWTIIIAGLLAWNLWQNRQITQQIAVAEARANFNKDQAFRFWATTHGGVYVPVDEQTPPNPYLSHVPERDIETPSGQQLTLMNPAYMVRQMNERFGELYGVVGHITSLQLLRPENAPDDWERVALLAFEQGEREVLEFTEIDGEPYLRLMQPMITQEGCLKCHGHQGYKVGDVRGGVGVALPMASLLASERQTNIANSLTLGSLWLLGMVALVIGGRSFNRRIVERNQAVTNLQQAHHLLQQERDMYISGSVVVFKWRNRENWPVEYVSANVKEMLGYTAMEFVQETILFADIVHPEDIMRVADEVEAHNQNHVEQFEHQPYRVIRQDGEVVWVLDHTTVIRDDMDRITHYLGYLVDITELKKSEEVVRISEERLGLTLKSAELGTWDWNIPTGEVVFNERWAQMLGYTLDEIAPDVSSWEVLVHPDDLPEVTAVLNDHLEGHTPIYQTEHRLRAKSGEWKWVLDTGKVLERDKQGQPIRAIGVHQDITERKQMELQLVRQERLAAVGQLSAGIAHDFNNILTSILGFVQVLQLSPDTPTSMQSRLQKINDSGQRAAHLVRQILDFSQKTVRQLQQVDLSSLVEKSIQFLDPIIPENIQINYHVQPGDYLINADPSQLQQVITNLAVNARDAMPAGGELQIALSRAESMGKFYCVMCAQPIKGEWIQLRVTDTGSGIAPDILPQIFEPFFSTKEVGKGSGLGLSQVSGIVGQHQGHTRVESQVGQGTTFIIYWPPAQVEQEAAEPEPVQLRQGAGETILVVEDETAVLEAITAILEYLGYQVLTAATGVEAITIFEASQSQIDLVLSDMVMPDMDGEALFQHIKATNPDVKMIMMSGYPLGDRGARLLEQGLVAWLQKPMSLERLSQAVSQVLSGNRSH
ncbi:MAG: PAS domain-containing protein [Ardenticatenaceae bacterium]|nr:PAS domain-containing protein [Ardenticatenaceae bacterium]